MGPDAAAGDRQARVPEPMFPLGTALLPGEPLPLRVFEPRYRRMLSDCLATAEESAVDGGPRAPRFGVVLIERGNEVGGGDVRHDVGTFAEIEGLRRAPDGRAVLTCTGTDRFRVDEWLADDPYPRAYTSSIDEAPMSGVDRERLGRLRERVDALAADEAIRRHLRPSGLPASDEMDSNDRDSKGPDSTGMDSKGMDSAALYTWAARLPMGSADRQRLLSTVGIGRQLDILDDVVATLSDIIAFGAR